jgi:Fuc2NAc and GlcNAc transferase|nr:glycosyltransferase family 4 protein [Pseudomonas sp. URMO17WK12:I12]
MFWMLILVFFSALFATWLLRKYALAANLIDKPNSRSSHTIPTPRGGGVAIVVTFLIALPFFGFFGLLSWGWVWSLLLPGSGIAILGFLDDHGHIAARWRLLGHFASAVVTLFFLQGLAPLNIFGRVIDFGVLGNIFAVFYLVWLLNLYNFMDGIDGLASIEAISACLGMCLIYWVLGLPDLIWPAAILAMCVSGFLFWNFPPAKIFMGDAGSGFLGITLGILSLHSAWVAPQLFCAWVIVLGVFINDATFTLIRRLLRGDKIYEAHRSHGYQYASRRYGNHLPVTMAVFGINVLWLLPLAFMVATLRISGFAGVLIAYIPLLLLAIKFKSGALEHSD